MTDMTYFIKGTSGSTVQTPDQVPAEAKNSAFDFKHAAPWLKVAAKRAHMTPTRFAFVGQTAYVWNTKRAASYSHSDQDYIEQYLM